jgi:Protein of unknown function (DUF683).
MNLKKEINMTEEQLKELELAVKKARFALSQKAGALHDLIEDRLPVDYAEIPEYAEAAYKACQEWDKLNQQLIEAKRQ